MIMTVEEKSEVKDRDIKMEARRKKLKRHSTLKRKL